MPFFKTKKEKNERKRRLGYNESLEMGPDIGPSYAQRQIEEFSRQNSENYKQTNEQRNKLLNDWEKYNTRLLNYNKKLAKYKSNKKKYEKPNKEIKEDIDFYLKQTKGNAKAVRVKLQIPWKQKKFTAKEARLSDEFIGGGELVKYDMSLFKLRKNYAKKIMKEYNFDTIVTFLKLKYIEDTKSHPIKQKSEFLAKHLFEPKNIKKLYPSLQKKVTEYNLKINQDFKILKSQYKVKKSHFDSRLGGGKKIRKHNGINQQTGRLKKGYRYSGKKLKSGLPQIIKKK